MRAERIAFGTLAALAALALAAPAGAFCRTTTVSVAPDFQPSPDQCWDQGKPLFWKNACVGYSVQKDASRQIAYDDASEAAARAFSRWTGKTCPGDAGGSRVSIDVRDRGPVECKLVQYNKTTGNANIIMFRDDSWPHADPDNTLALTTVTFNPETGEIYDADMEVNTRGQKMTVVDPVPADGFDFGSIVTHEAGHFLGIAHSGDSNATMYASYRPGSTRMRELAPDDVNAICAVYRADGTRDTADGPLPAEPCDPTPRRGFLTTCGSSKGGCAATPGAPSGTGAVLLSLVVALAALSRRRRDAV
jgi:MYXO-CTERM domain-containing protein